MAQRRGDGPDPVPIRLVAPRYRAMTDDQRATAVAALAALLAHARTVAGHEPGPTAGDVDAAGCA